jgi:hypothetical protein
MDRSIPFITFTANVKQNEVNTYSNWLGHSYRLRVERDKMLIALKPVNTTEIQYKKRVCHQRKSM